MSVTVTPLTPRVGVEIAGMSPREPVIREAADDCRAALQRHGVVASREAHFDDDDLVVFSRVLGEVAVVSTDGLHRPEIQTITLDPSRTNALLGAYAAYEAPHFVLRHHWRRGDLVMWDNTRMLHRAPSFAPTSRRLLHRTALVGEEAVA